MCRIVMTLRTTKPKSIRNSSLGGPCSNLVLSSSSGESGITWTCSALLLSLCGKSHEMWEIRRRGQKRWERTGAGEDDESPISKSPRPGAPEVVVSRTHPYTHTHSSPISCRCCTLFCFVLYWSQTHPCLYRIPNIRCHCPTVWLPPHSGNIANDVARVCDHSFARIVVSNPASGTDLYLLLLLCVVRYGSPRRADHSARGALLIVVCLSVIVNSRQWGGPGHGKKMFLRWLFSGISTRWNELCSRAVHVWFLVDRVALRAAFLLPHFLSHISSWFSVT